MQRVRHTLGMARALPALLAALACASCAGTPRGMDVAPGTRAMHIELLGLPGCPNTPTMRRNLTEALHVVGMSLRFDDVNQERLPAADVRRGYPTPTVLVDGADLYGLPTPTGPAMGCRVYPGGVPSAEDIASRLRERLARR